MAKEELYIEAKLDAEQLYQDLKELKSQIEKKNMDIKVNAKLTKDAQQVASQVNNITQANTKAAKAAEDNAEATQKLNKTVTEWAQAFSELNPKIQQQYDLIAKLKEEKKMLKEAMKDPLTATEETRRALDFTNESLKNAQKELRKMQQPIQEATTWVWKLFQSLKAASAHSITTWLLSTFWAFSLAWAVKKTLQGLIKTIKDSINSFISFESAFAWVKKTVEATDYQFDAFNKTLKEMTTYVPMAYEDLAKIAELGWQMGVPIENLAKFTETLAAISVSTNLWLEDAALALSRISAVMWIDYNDVDRLGSAIVDLWNNFAATESEITTFMEKIAWTANVVWMSAWDVAWISAAITSVWVASEKWWTAVNKLSLAINDAVTKWWKKLKILADITWQTQKEFQELWKADAWEAFVQVIEWIGAAWQNATRYIEALVWTWTRMKEVVLNIASAGSKLREAIEMGNDAYRTNIALMAEAAKRYGTTESQIQMLNNQLKLNKAALWEELTPLYIKLKTALVELSKVVLNVVEWYNKLSDAAKTWTLSGWVLALASALFLLFKPLWLIVWVLGWWLILFDKLYKLTNKDSEALTRLHDAMEDANKELYAVEDEMAQLNEDLADGKISVETYNRKMKELRDTMMDLKEKQDELADSTARYQDIQSDVDFLKEWLEERQNKVNDLTEAVQKQERLLEWLSDKQEDLNVKYENGQITLKKYNDEILKNNKQIKEETDNLNKLTSQRDQAEASANKYAAAYSKVGNTLQQLNDKYGDTKEFQEWYNSMKFDSSYNIQQINAITQAFEQMWAEAVENAIKAKIAAENFLEEQTKWHTWQWNFWDLLKADWNVITWKQRRQKQALKEANDTIALWNKVNKEIEDAFNEIKSINTQDLLDFDVNTASKDKLEQEIHDLNSTMNLYNSTSEEYLALNNKLSEATKQLADITKEEEEALGSLIDKEASEEEILKQKEKLLKLEAEQRLLYLRANIDNEKEYAEAALAVDEWLTKAKEDLRKDWYDKEIDSVNEIIEKYKELKKEAEKAFSWLADDVKDVSSDISKLVKKIQDLRKQLQDLEEDRVTDLWERYVKLQQDLEEIDKQIAELTAKTSERWDTWETVTEAWESIQNAIDEATDNVEDYKKEIEKLEEKMKDLQDDTTDKLSDRYAAVVEEVQKLNKELEVYTKYDILTDADAKAKATLEEQIASLLSEKNKIEQNLTAAQLERAENMVGETETDKILRQAAEQKAAYQQEIDDYKAKMEEQNSILEQYRAQESEMLEKYNFLDTKSSQAKYDEMIKQLEEYKDERDAILKEMDMISQNLTAQQIQEAILNSKKTETELILENYYTQKQALEDELNDYENQLNKKLELLAKYYWDAALLQQKYGDVWIRFSDEDLQKIKEAAENMKWIKDTTAYSNYGWNIFKTQQDALDEQKKAQKNLESISKMLEKLTDYQLKSVWTENLKELYNKILQLQLTASGKGIGTGNVTTTSNISQSFNVNNVNDAAVIASAIRRQIKL